MTAEEALAELRAKIERIGPVNMMAIEQSKELEERHTFLTGQRQDLVDSIAQTNEAISKSDETTHARFREAFNVDGWDDAPCVRPRGAVGGADAATADPSGPVPRRARTTRGVEAGRGAVTRQ